MANPLSAEGVSDKDFAAAVGIAMGETGSKRISKDEMAAVIDVAKNRLEGYDRNRHFAKEPTLHGVITARGQFDASNPRGSIGGRQKYDAGYNAIMNGAPVPANMRARYDAAVKQAIGVLSKDGPLRGTARNAEYFSSTGKKLSAAKAREHAKLGKGTGTKIGASTFYGPEHTKQYGKRDAPTPARREDQYSKFGQEGTPREKLSQPFATEDYSKFGPLGTPREAIPPAAAYNPAELAFGPDFSSPPSQARGPSENPYGFSNIDTSREAVPGSFSSFGPNAFGALDQAPVDYGKAYPELGAGLYPDIAPPDVPAVPNVMDQFPERPFDFDAAFEGFPEDDATGALGNPQMSVASPYSPGYSAGTGAQLGVPDFAALSALDRENAYQAEVAAMRDPAATAARGAWSDQAEVGPRPAGPDPTPFQGGLYGDPATPAGGFTQGLDFSQPVGPSPDRFSGGPAETAFNSRMSEALQPGPAPPAELSAFQNAPLGLGQGFIDQGPYSSPISGLGSSFSPANLGNPMPNSTAVATQAPAAPTTVGASPQIIGYEPGKAITRDVPNPAWSEWSKDYATANASQNAWAAADEDKRAWDRAPPNPNVLADTQWAGLGKEPPKTIPETKIAAATPIYGKPEVVAAPVVSVPAVQAQPRVAAQPVAAQPLARTVAAPAAAPVGVGGWWDSITTGIGNALSGMSLAGLGDYSGYGAFGGGYDPGGYGGGGFGGTAPGDAGYGSDARSGAGNMGAGNLYQ